MKDYAEGCGIFVERWKGAPETSPPSYILCHHGKSGPPLGWLTRDPVFLKETSTNYTN